MHTPSNSHMENKIQQRCPQVVLKLLQDIFSLTLLTWNPTCQVSCKCGGEEGSRKTILVDFLIAEPNLHHLLKASHAPSRMEEKKGGEENGRQMARNTRFSVVTFPPFSQRSGDLPHSPFVKITPPHSPTGWAIFPLSDTHHHSGWYRRLFCGPCAPSTPSPAAPVSSASSGCAGISPRLWSPVTNPLVSSRCTRGSGHCWCSTPHGTSGFTASVRILGCVLRSLPCGTLQSAFLLCL